MSRMWQERADYGHFFYRIPNGESAADAYDRVSGFNESMWRSFGEDDFASVCVLVTHGLMTRVFLMKWYHFSVEYFEDLRNMNHCEFVVMKQNADNGKYILQNQLRTWSQLKKDKEEAAAAAPQSPVPVRKKWVGCVDGDGPTRRPRRQNTADLFMDDDEAEDEQDDESLGTEDNDLPSPSSPRSERNRLLSPNRLAILKGGRDFGGSRSGDVSRSGSSDEEEKKMGIGDDGVGKKRMVKPLKTSMAMALHGALESEGMRSGTRADALGDQSDVDDDEGRTMEGHYEDEEAFRKPA